MNAPIRVLIADDSAVLRRIVAEALTLDDGFEVFGAVDGRDAVDQVHRINPDVVVLDVEMPEMNGVEAARIIRELDAKLPIIMFCSSSVENREATTAALEYGANDCVIKTMRIGYVTAAIQHLREQLAPKVRLWAERRANSTKNSSLTPNEFEYDDSQTSKRFDVVVVGAASAGPRELTRLLRDFPEDFELPILVAHHMPPALTQLLLDQVEVDCPLAVTKASQDQPLSGNRIWFAPGGSNLTIEFDFNQYFLSIDHGLPENPGRTSIDALFLSAAKQFGGRTLGVVLAGIGHDGLVGSRLIREIGGHLVVQDTQNARFGGLPRILSEEGIANSVLPLTAISNEVVRLVDSQDDSSDSINYEIPAIAGYIL